MHACVVFADRQTAVPHLCLCLQVLQCLHHQNGGHQQPAHSHLVGGHDSRRQLLLHLGGGVAGGAHWAQATHTVQSCRWVLLAGCL